MAAKKRPHVVVNISFHDDDWDHDETVTFLGRTFRLIRQGTSGDAESAEDLVWRWSLKADAIAVTGMREAQAAGVYDGDESAFDDVKGTTKRVPITTGRMLADVLQEWAIRHVNNEMPGYFMNARTLVLGGGAQQRTVKVLREFTENIEFVDPFLALDVPETLSHNPVLAKAAELGLFTFRHLPQGMQTPVEVTGEVISHALARRAARDADIIVAAYDELDGFGLEDLAGKALITNAISPERLEDLAARGVDLVEGRQDPRAAEAIGAWCRAGRNHGGEDNGPRLAEALARPREVQCPSRRRPPPYFCPNRCSDRRKVMTGRVRSASFFQHNGEAAQRTRPRPGFWGNN